jgi:ankyrin repeat protein
MDRKALNTKLKKFIIFLSSKLSNISIFFSEVIENYHKPKHSYYFPNSHDLFFAIKSKNLKLAEKLLDAEKYLVLDFDYFKMTALHLAAKYNFYQIIPKLFEYGSHMDDKNYIGDTPLLISVKHKYMMSTIFLLLYMASPFIKDKEGLNALYYSKFDFKLNIILKKIISLHYVSILGKTKNKIEFIQKEFSNYIINEYKNDLEVDAFNMINGRLEFYKRTNKNN